MATPSSPFIVICGSKTPVIAELLSRRRTHMRSPKVWLTLLVLPISALADEGMWTFDAFPARRVEQAYGFRPERAWLDRTRLSSARLAQGCSASFVSGTGLVMTNHHCALECIEQLSSTRRDLAKGGFYARALGDELKCPALEVDELLEIADVTARMNKATAGLEGQRYNEAQRAAMATIERECQSSDQLRCEVVALYHGGIYDVYRYKRYQDVRLVFAPEFAIAFFGGDPDNFNFPRYDLDVSFLRVYEGDQPARTDHFFRWSRSGAKEGELVFVPGNPGATRRELTVAQLEYIRDAALPDALVRTAELRGLVTEYQRRGPEQARHSSTLLFEIENRLKASKGRFEALLDEAFFASRVRAEKDLKAKLALDARARKSLPAFGAIASAEVELRKIRKELDYIERGQAFSGKLFQHARNLVRASVERQKPNDRRLREYQEAALPSLRQSLLSQVPIHGELEVLELTFSLTKLRENLGASHPFVRKVLAKSSPRELAEQLVRSTRLGDVSCRQRLWEGGAAAVWANAKDDAMLEMAIRVDEDGRAIRKRYEDDIESVVKRSSEAIARARFEVEGTSTYPDATFTPRLSYGTVAGYAENGRAIAPITTLAGAFERETGRDPFALPKRWLDAKAVLNLATPFNMALTNDVVGGNSGSPVIDREARVVGIIFDGNIHSLGGDYGFDASVNRAIAVQSAAIIEALSKIYRADRLVNELAPESDPPAR